MDAVAHLAGERRPVAEIRSAMRAMVSQRLSVNSEAKKGNSQKATCILMRAWVTVPKEMVALRDQGLELFEKADDTERLALHWGMCMVAYPFFTMVAESTGRLLRLQGTVVQAQVLGRIWDQIGERETVTRAAQRVLRTFADWAVLDYVEEPGIYKARQASAIGDPNLAAWMIEAILLSGGQKYLPLHTLRTSHSIFPFSLQSVSTGLIGKQRRLEIVRQGLDEELVGIR
jgi:hypothetical protein